MCRSFEVISGKKNKGDKGLLKGLTKMYRDAKYSVAIIPIPVELLEIDTRYQTEVRTDRSLMYLVNNWDENKLLPLIGVPHWEEGKVYLVDGYGRWVASQMVDKEKYTDLQVLLILNAPNNAEERLEFEAEMYAYQNKQVARMTAIQKHGAMVVLHDKATERLEKLKEKYGFEYASCKGNRSASVLGSYSVTLNICNIDDGKAAEFIFDICKGAGFDRKPNGYSTGIMKVLLDMDKHSFEEVTYYKEVLAEKYENREEETNNMILRNKLKKHRGHKVSIVSYGDWNNPVDICLECEDCGEVVLDAEIYTLCERENN